MTGFTKADQLESQPIKLKHCPKCNQDLPIASYTSTRAKYCLNCKKIIELEQKQEMTNRALGRSQKKKQKTAQVISIADLKKKVQKVFNAWIRERDKNEPCLACGKRGVKMDASHLWAMGSNGILRYNEDNVNNTCQSCNRFKGGNLLEYRLNLIKKIGEDRVKWLDDNHTKTHKFTREELLELLENYKIRNKG